MKRTLALLFIVVLTIGLALGCAKPSPIQDNPASVDGSSNNSGNVDVEEGVSGRIADKATEATGRYTGKIDGNSVEIEMSPTDIVAFRSSEVSEQLNTLEDGDNVKFSYETNEYGQFVLKSIEKLEE